MDESTKQWASEWIEAYDQGYTEEQLRGMCGKKVRATAPADEEGNSGRVFDFRIIGFTVDTIPTDEADVHRFSLITDDGRAIALRSGTTVEDLPEE